MLESVRLVAVECGMEHEVDTEALAQLNQTAMSTGFMFDRFKSHIPTTTKQVAPSNNVSDHAEACSGGVEDQPAASPPAAAPRAGSPLAAPPTRVAGDISNRRRLHHHSQMQRLADGNAGPPPLGPHHN